MTEWAVINKDYYINTLGQVKSYANNKKGVILKNQLQNNGYYTIGINCKLKLVHRLLAIAFIPNPDNKPQVNHINGIKTDNRVENLEWCTRSENSVHALKTGLQKVIKGESYKSKLTEKEVLEIRNSKLNNKDLSLFYGVNIPSISLIRNRKTWKHI